MTATIEKQPAQSISSMPSLDKIMASMVRATDPTCSEDIATDPVLGPAYAIESANASRGAVALIAAEMRREAATVESHDHAAKLMKWADELSLNFNLPRH